MISRKNIIGLSHLRPCYLFIILLGIAALFVSGCERRVYVRGNMPEEDAIQSVQAGSTTRDDVLSMLGTPSTISSFQDRTWYYIGEKQSKWAFRDPNVLERKVLVISFLEDGYVEDKALYTYEDGVIVDPVSRETPTSGRELTILQQLFGNIGRFPNEALQ